MKMIYILLFCLFFTLPDCLAQRHYQGVSSIEANLGGRINQGFPYTNFSYSKYLTYTSYFKLGANTWKSEYFHEEERLDLKSDAYFMDAMYFQTLITNHSFFFLNLGFGGFLGMEKYNKDYEFIIGPSFSLEPEFFFTRNIAFLLNVTQYYSPLGKIKKWDTSFSVGLKYIIY